ncbi:MAG: threonine ammonia-lyase, partial [Candidatus Eiseniibacteriota bacterium]
MPISRASEPTYDDVARAAERLEGKAVRTPLLASPALDAELGCRLRVKAEMLQRTGSFKFRGAYNRMSRLTAAARAKGVVAYSSGNHGQGVADAARLLDIHAAIVMPADAPAIKIANTRALGAEVVFYDRYHEDRAAVAGKLAEQRGATIVPPFDDPDIIAGQGTVGLELAAQLGEEKLVPDLVLVPCGGGGLLAGTSLAVKHAFPDALIYAVEPEGFDDTGRSLAAGTRVANEPGHVSACDALLSPSPGEITFAINRRLVAGGLAVSDDEAFRAMAKAYAVLKVVLEPGGAVALAAVLSGKIECRGRTVAVVCSGGNV